MSIAQVARGFLLWVKVIALLSLLAMPHVNAQPTTSNVDAGSQPSLLKEEKLLKEFRSATSSFKELWSGRDSPARACGAILTGDHIYDRDQRMSSSYSLRKFFNWACDSDFQTSSEMDASATNLGLTGAIEALSGEFSLSDVRKSSNFKQSLHEWCAIADARLEEGSFYQRFTEVVSAQMVSAYKHCMDAEKAVILERFGVYAYAMPHDVLLRTYSVVLEVRSITGVQTTLTSIEAPNVDCTLAGELVKLPMDLSKKNSITFSCVKRNADRTLLSFNTEPTGASPPIQMPGESDGILISMRDDLRRTKGELALQRDQNRKFFQALSTRRLECRALPAEDHQAQPACGSGEYTLAQWCSGDCSGDDARATLCCKIPPEIAAK